MEHRGARTAFACAAFAALAAMGTWMSAAHAGPIDADIWYEFGFAEVGVDATGCDPADPAGPFCIPPFVTPTTFLDAPPWTFVAPAGGSSLQVTDVFQSGDQFEVSDFGVSIGSTSLPVVATPPIDCDDDPAICVATPGMSTGSFSLAAGPHSITLTPVLALDGGGVGYLRISAAVVSIPEPGSLALLAIGLLGGLARRYRAR